MTLDLTHWWSRYLVVGDALARCPGDALARREARKLEKQATYLVANAGDMAFVMFEAAYAESVGA